ncbi:MAG TPA: hypothetical protein VL172_00655 [Kofleriaceae bacterium]|nr:hypothetical protein [Kofleriaceae bacterium]
MTRSERDARTLYRQAWSRHQLGRHAEALELVERAIAADPDQPNAHNLAGWLLLRHLQSRPDARAAAIAHFEEARRRFPDDPVPPCNLADALLETGAVDRAVALMTEAAAGAEWTVISRAENWLGWYHLLQRGDATAALPWLERAVAHAAWWGPAWQNRGRALESTGDAGGARGAYVRALECGDPYDLAMVLARLGAIDRDQDRPRRALSWFRRALHVEREAGGARVDEIAAACAAVEDRLRASDLAFPAADVEERWIVADLAAKQLAHGIDVRAAGDAVRLRFTRALERDEPDPEFGPQAPIAALIAGGRHDDALAALTELERTDVDRLFAHVFLIERAGDDATADGDPTLARRYYALAEDAYAWYASGASAGGEGLARMVDVDRLRRKLRPAN